MAQSSGRPGTAADRAHSAAFAIQIELSTRIGARRLGDSEGILREALTSLRLVSETVQEVIGELQEPDLVAGGGDADADRVRACARRLDDVVLRPFLDRWDPLLAEHERLRPPGGTLVAHEARWAQAQEFRSALRDLSEPLIRINRELADITGADLEPPLPEVQPRTAGPRDGRTTP
ncbi:hypothetical protein HNR23_004934 [Nocardiopsis mwathae]|uniref:Uncharacterized protein n=1 Tax=Nocardiopsis mwathae TaxID=1472723 RepID=A0A7X0D9B2_9ACTN|nr:hypothetical protein [Nocardiopsis mwathae]MBB6174874.1 hypothetical protein [Nocardiopsis mwathae]